MRVMVIDGVQQSAVPRQIDQFFEELGIEYEYVYVIKEFIDKPKASDINRWKPTLLKEIEAYKPTHVLLVGAHAVKATIGGSVTSQLGLVVEKDGIKYLPTFSPGIINRDPGKAEFVYHALNNFRLLLTDKELDKATLNIQLISTKKQLLKAFNKLANKSISYDIETSGLSRFDEYLHMLGFGNDEVQYIIPSPNHKWSPLYRKPRLHKALIKLAIKKMNQVCDHRIAGNGKFDNLFLEHHLGIKPILTFDTNLASHCLDENTPNGVKENAILECNAHDWDVNKTIKTGNLNSHQDYKDYIEYLGYDIYYEYKLFEVFNPRIQNQGLDKLFFHLYMPCIRAYEEIEANGIYVNQEQFEAVEEKLKGDLAQIDKKLAEYKKDINWASPVQLGEFLYEELKLPVLETTPSGKPATGESVLLRLRGEHPVVQLILDRRGVAIQISHFIDGWKSFIHNGRMNPSFQMTTVTGRTSCKNPNLQQVPRDPIIRNLVSAPKGYAFIEVDFSQAELRVAALMSQDETMMKAYKEGIDIHTLTYEMVSHERLSSDPKEAKEQRKKAKAINFGFLYGMGFRKFKEYARDSYGVDVTEDEAKQIRQNFFRTYSALPDWHEKQRKMVRMEGQVRNLIGRVRRLPNIYSVEQGKRAEAERQSINSPVQGFGSDLTLLGMAEAAQYSLRKNHKWSLDKTQFRCVGTVHDATLFEVKIEYLEEFIPKIKKIMESPKALRTIFKFKPDIPIEVDVSVGKTWGSGTEIDFDKDLKEQISGLKLS